MLNRSNMPIEEEERHFDSDFRASCEYYTQNYRAVNLLHYHNCLELGRCFDGSGVQFMGGEVYSFNASSVSIVQKGCIHDSHIIMLDSGEKPSEWKYIFVDLDALGIPCTMDRSFVSGDKELLFLYDLLFNELEMHPAGWREQFCLLLPAFLRIAQRLEPNTRPMRHTALADQIAALLHWIALEYASDLSVEQLANHCNMSVSYFRKVFCENVGMGPQQYVLHVRLSMAKHLLLTTSKPILEISEEVGFHSVSSFNRQFLRAYKCSPRVLRREG